MSKIGQLEGFLGRLLGPLIQSGLPLVKNVHKPLAKSILTPVPGSGTLFMISNEEEDDIMKIVKSFKDTGLLIKMKISIYEVY